MDAALTRLVWRRANGCCEYCQMPQVGDPATFAIDHIVALKHIGPTVASNLCLSCYYCNAFKGSDLSSIDRKTRKLTPLFNPRRHKWAKHFQWDRAYLIGRTAIGRVTITLLHINDEYRVDLREGLIAEGAFPPGG
jgi:HNH endonuclease